MGSWLGGEREHGGRGKSSSPGHGGTCLQLDFSSFHQILPCLLLLHLGTADKGELIHLASLCPFFSSRTQPEVLIQSQVIVQTPGKYMKGHSLELWQCPDHIPSQRTCNALRVVN